MLSDPKGSKGGGKLSGGLWVTAYPFDSCSLQVVRRKEKCRSSVGSQSWEAVAEADATVPSHKIIEEFGLERTFKDNLVHSPALGRDIFC